MQKRALPTHLHSNQIAMEFSSTTGDQMVDCLCSCGKIWRWWLTANEVRIQVKATWHLFTMGPFAIQPQLGPRSAQLGLGTGRCVSICNLDQTFIRDLMTSSYQTHHPSAILPDHISVFQTADDTQQNVTRAIPYSGAMQSAAHICPGTGNCKSTIPRSASAQHRKLSLV